MRTAKALLALLAPLLVLGPNDARGQDPIVFTVGSGDLSGVYYSVARATCRLFNARSPGDLRCSAEPTYGSLYNLAMLRDAEFDFALVQSDWQRAAYEGTGPFASDGPATWLRSVGSLYSEPITIVARNDPTLREAADLEGRRVDIGPITSGRHSTVRTMLRRLELDETFFGELTNYDPRRAVEGLCDGRLDAAIFVVGHPSAIVRDAIEGCGAKFLPFDGPLAQQTAEAFPDYGWADIPAGTYSGQSAAVTTLSVHATLVTRSDVDPGLVERFGEALLAAREALGAEFPQISQMKVIDPAAKGLVAPRHEGIERLSRR